MNNQKEENIRRAIWHIKRHLDALSSAKIQNIENMSCFTYRLALNV